VKKLTFLIFSLLSLTLFGQREADNWIFGERLWLNFSTGIPVDSSANNPGIETFYGSTSLSDSLGNLIFYSDGRALLNRYHDTMPNGRGLKAGWTCPNPCIAFPKPGDPGKYYIFTVGGGEDTVRYGSEYSIIDMSLDGGKGDIIPGQKNIPLIAADSTYETIAGFKHGSRDAYWVILRNHRSPNKILAFLVDESGVNQSPVVSPCILYFRPEVKQSQNVKASADGKYLLYASRSFYTGHEGMVELYHFNNVTGQCTQALLFNTGAEYNTGAEFSANSQYMYMSNGKSIMSGLKVWVSQYDMSKINDLAQFEGSVYRMAIDTIVGLYGNHLLANNGRIYFISKLSYDDVYLSEIINPSIGGAGCNLNMNIMPLIDVWEGLPTFVSSFMTEFDWTGSCESDTVRFNSRFTPEPVSYLWNFDDPGSGALNTSTLPDPSHVFNIAGEYDVSVTVTFPNGNVQTSSRTVYIFSIPVFNLGDTIKICEGSSTIISPGSNYNSYLWNTGETGSSISASVPGLYWVSVTNEGDCQYTDSVWVSFKPPVRIVEDNLVKSPTTCGGKTGAITGLTFSGQPPFTVTWTDMVSGNVISHSPDIFNLGVGVYQLTLTDASGCSTPQVSYNIIDVGEVLIDTVTNTSSACNMNTGQIDVVAVSGLGSRIQYFLKHNNDTLTQWHNGLFTGLEPGVYYIWASDSSGCTCIYNDAVTITRPDGPTITDQLMLAATWGKADGSIILKAESSTSDTLYYTVNGITLINNGYFDDLYAGDYECTVTDESGCSTTIWITVTTLDIFYLQAIAGKDSVCMGQTARTPIKVSNFNNIKSFETVLKYEEGLVECAGYFNFNPLLGGSVEPVSYPSAGIVKIKWTGSSPVSLPDNSTILELLFKTNNTGNSFLNWDIAPGVNHFFDPNGLEIPVTYSMGEIKINNPPEVSMQDFAECESNDLSYSPNVLGGTGSLNYTWITPEGNHILSNNLEIPSFTSDDTGEYTFIASDSLNCSDTVSIQINIIPLPKANFPATNPTRDTIPFQNSFDLTAQTGYPYYHWNTGETSDHITVTEGGTYSVIIETSEGCSDTSSVVMVKIPVVEIRVPTAFTPNKDGLNDVFRPIFNTDLIKHFTLVVYNNWGQRIFETNDFLKGWDGRNAPSGVYAWIISYSDFMDNDSLVKGSVVLIK